MIIIVSCFGRKARESEQIHPVDFDQSQFDPDYIAGFTVGDESDEEENPITLTERDYDRWMPVINIADIKSKGEKLFDETCTICLDVIENGEKVRQVCTCKHAYHSECLIDWIKVNESCPNCKEELTKRAMLKKELKQNMKMKKTKTLTSQDKKEEPRSRRTPHRRNPVERRIREMGSNRPQPNGTGLNMTPQSVRVAPIQAASLNVSVTDLNSSQIPLNRQDLRSSVDNSRNGVDSIRVSKLEADGEGGTAHLTDSQYAEYL